VRYWRRRRYTTQLPRTPAQVTGRTPLTRACVVVGAQFLEPGGSIKDRVALHMLRTAEARGELTPHSGDKVYEGTVGSTGVSLATLCRARGYLAHIIMPSDQSIEKSSLLEKLGAEVSRVPPAPIVDQNQFVNRARNLARVHTDSTEIPGRGYFADQFENDANWRAHFESTAPEIWNQCGGRLDAFVAGAGTGGTISGVAKYLKQRIPGVKVVLADPPGSGLYNRVKYGVMFASTEREGTRRRHQVDTIVEGIGINRVTHNFEVGRSCVDDAERVTDEEAMAMARYLVEKEGIFVGSSSCVNLVAAVRTALKLGPGKRVVTIMCDSGTRHLSKFWAQAGNVGAAWDMTLMDVLEADKRHSGTHGPKVKGEAAGAGM
jgi:cysteine synthase A